MATVSADPALEAFRARLDQIIGRLRVVERAAPGQRQVLNEILDELVRLYRDIGGVDLGAVRPTSSHSPGPRHMGPKRRCPTHNGGRGANVSVSRFRPGREICRECERYVAFTTRSVTVEVIEGDRCIGHDCPICGLPFEIGDRIKGDNLHHEGCA